MDRVARGALDDVRDDVTLRVHDVRAGGTLDDREIYGVAVSIVDCPFRSADAERRDRRLDIHVAAAVGDRAGGEGQRTLHEIEKL